MMVFSVGVHWIFGSLSMNFEQETDLEDMQSMPNKRTMNQTRNPIPIPYRVSQLVAQKK